jgi:putative colanic acid biosysnthesis UDP-glucose lipid carrier transferase
MATPAKRSNRLNAGLLAIIPPLVPPIVASGSLYALTRLFDVSLEDPYRVLLTLTFLITFVIYREVTSGSSSLTSRALTFLQRSLVAWAIVVSLLAVLGFALQLGEAFSRRVLLTWAVITPIAIAALQYWSYIYISQRVDYGRRAVIAGVSDLSRKLAQKINGHSGRGVVLEGWFDDRSLERVGPVKDASILGSLNDLPAYVQKHNIDVIYIALPIRHEERTRRLLDELHDTTASIYFVPDIFVFDLIQSRVDSIDGIPVLALCETPFVGVNGLVKRMSDLLLATAILSAALPFMVLISAGIAVSSPGSVIFKQRRYGLDGREITVYKFRTMRTSEDADVVRQASRDDERVTAFGRFLRRYSLDELPQLFNVLQGQMSLVGPRPHAVAHNEEYRKLIKGYMIRHKVAPGMTGLAQIRGYRGETKTVDQMKARVECDLEYLRSWSLALDIKILITTCVRVFRDSKAF